MRRTRFSPVTTTCRLCDLRFPKDQGPLPEAIPTDTTKRGPECAAWKLHTAGPKSAPRWTASSLAHLPAFSEQGAQSPVKGPE